MKKDILAFVPFLASLGSLILQALLGSYAFLRLLCFPYYTTISNTVSGTLRLESDLPFTLHVLFEFNGRSDSER